MNPTVERLREAFYVQDGKLIRKSGGWRSTKNGDRKPGGNGYLLVSLDNRMFYVHRAIWAITYGRWPKILDHIDGNPLNNAIDNLRECTQSQNLCNKRISSNNKSGATGVHFDKSRRKWIASINVDGKPINLGRHESFELAQFVRQCAAEKYHGEFARFA